MGQDGKASPLVTAGNYRSGAAALAVLTVLCISACCVPHAFAGSVSNQRPLLFSVDGSDSSIGSFTALGPVASDESTGDLYALNQAGNGKGPGEFDAKRVVCKFDMEGKAQVFSATGKACLDPDETAMEQAFGVEGFFEETAFRVDIAIDNSGGSGGPGEGEQGRIYVSELEGPIHAFSPQGEWLWTLPEPPAKPNVVVASCGIAVDHQGRLWVGGGEKYDKALEFETTGKAPPSEIPLKEVKMTRTPGSKRPCRLAIDNSGKGLYSGMPSDGISNGGGIDKYLEGVYDSTLTTEVPFDVTIDQSNQSGHIFAVSGANFTEYQPCEALGCLLSPVVGSPFGGDLIGNGFGVAYNPATDRVYIADRASNTIKVFGPRASGTVPDVTPAETDEIDQNEATLHGVVNPQGVPNDYFFEYVPASDSWATAKTTVAGKCSPPAPLAEDIADHPVACEAGGLKGNTSFKVRLVGENSTNNLKAYSSAQTFKTLPPPTPIVNCLSPAAITTESAHLECMIDPQKDQTSWKVLRSPRPGASEAQCKALPDSAFKTAVKEGTIPAEEAGSVKIEVDLTALNPAETNCVRVIATNGGGSGRADLAFMTKAISPGAAEIGFVAPRTDTTARLNARIDPEGEATLTYHFEYQEEGAGAWIVLPDTQYSGGARTLSVIGQDIAGLTPATSYRYRLAKAENEAGAAPSLGGEGMFTTRTLAEVTLPANALGEAGKRGIELVNSPDKGDQNVVAFGPLDHGPAMSADGEEALWTVAGGAPGSNSGSQAAFLAKRSPGGWESKSLLPPAKDQIGGGSFVYRVESTTPDFEKFIFQVAKSDAFLVGKGTVVRLDQVGNQDVLTSYEELTAGLAADLSTDGVHVVAVNPNSLQLQDIGSGTPELLNLAPGGGELVCGSEGFNGADNRQWRPGYHWIATTDASRVYFEAKPNKASDPSKCEESAPEGLYVRIRTGEGKGKTTLIDPGTAGKEPEFIRATPDGRASYFLTSGSCRKYRQTSPTTCETGEPDDANGHPDVYRWNEELGKGGESRCLTCEVSPDADVARVGTLVSDDFSHIYFVSKKQLTPQAVGGDQYIYVLRGGQIGLVAATTARTPAPLGGGNDMARAPRLSADGGALSLVLQGNLSADTVAELCPQTPLTRDVSPGDTPCEELYRYDDAEGSIECLSCLHGGISTRSIGSSYGGPQPAHFKMSADGSTVALVTAQRLLGADVNNDVDIYEWRNGVTRLITDGVTHLRPDDVGPQINGIDTGGANVLFSLGFPDLTGYERDGLANVYDARIGGGFPRPIPPAHCIEDSCQGPLQPAPPIQGGSAGFHGYGNLKKAPSHCRKGKVRRHGRCVARHPHQRKRAGHAKGGKGR